MNAFEVLGLTMNADEAQVRAAYRSSVKRCHPDQFQEKEQQEKAQEQLIRLNLAYEEALRITAQRQVGFNTVPVEDAKHMAQKLLEQERLDNAMRQLMRAERRDAEWHYIQGQILTRMRHYSTALQSYREAVRLEPNELRFRRAAFEAAQTVKKHQKPLQRAIDTIDGLLHPKHREIKR